MLKYLVMITLICTVGCSESILGPAVNEQAAKADAAVSVLVAHLEADGKDTKPDNRPSGKCATCNGTGKVGDRVHMYDCQDCNGTGVVTATLGPAMPINGQPQNTTEVAPVTSNKKLFVFGAEWCGPCKVWKENKAKIDAIKARGIEVHFLDVDNPNTPKRIGRIAVTNIPFFLYQVDKQTVYYSVGDVDLNRLQ